MDEFAPEYTQTEKIRLVFGRYIWIISTLFIIHIWIFTSYARFVDNSACEKFGPLLGAELVLYGLYVGMPMLIGVPCLIYGYLRGKKIITQGQDPLRGEKVWKRRPYVYGWRAHIRYFCALSAFFLLLIFSADNIVNSHEIIYTVAHSSCDK